jgi:hypothetical protein
MSLDHLQNKYINSILADMKHTRGCCALERVRMTKCPVVVLRGYIGVNEEAP